MGFTKLGNDELAKRPRMAAPGALHSRRSQRPLRNSRRRRLVGVSAGAIVLDRAAVFDACRDRDDGGRIPPAGPGGKERKRDRLLLGAVAFVLQVLSLGLCGCLHPFETSVYGPGADAAGGDAIELLPAALICAIVVIILDLGRRALKELKRRGAWERRFGPARPNRKLWLAGTLIVAGPLCLVGSVATLADQTRAFNESSALLPACSASKSASFSKRWRRSCKRMSPANRELATRRIEALGEKVAQLKRTIALGSRLLAVLEEYEEAVAQWKLATAIIAVAEPDWRKLGKCFSRPMI